MNAWRYNRSIVPGHHDQPLDASAQRPAGSLGIAAERCDLGDNSWKLEAGSSKLTAAVLLVAITLFARGTAAQTTRRAAAANQTDPIAALDRAVAAAEASLKENELHRAESQYRAALLDAWMIVGHLHVAGRRFPEARDAFAQAAASAVDANAAIQALALVHLQTGESAEAVTILTRLAGRTPRDTGTKRLLAQAQLANGQQSEALQTLEEARTVDPNDSELAFALAAAHLRAGKVDAATPLFAAVSKARPGPETDVLIGRTYRDYGFYDRARASLARALKQDPKARRAHYYLGTLAFMDESVMGMEQAVDHFRAELPLAPRDPATNLRLGMALVEAQRPAEALRHLTLAAESQSAPAEAFYYLGRCQLAVDDPAGAVASLRRALALIVDTGAEQAKLRSVHYQLALALRRTGQESEAAAHFDEAKAASARRTDDDRERLAQYLTDAPLSEGPSASRVLTLESPFASLPLEAHDHIERRAKTIIARANMNLGVLQAQAQRFARAAECFEQAAAVDPLFPQLQYALGVAYFNAKRYDKAAPPLERALAGDTSNLELRRMLALAWFNAEAFDKAAQLLAADPGRESDPALQYTYGLALVRTDRAAEAEEIFSRLLAQHADNAELHVVLGQAHAQQGDYDAAIQSLRRAVELKPAVAEANAALGTIYLKQGRLAEASSALKAELAAHPEDTRAQHTLATVLDLDGQSAEALSILRRLLKVTPDHAGARYLVGKILLAQGAAADAVEQLQAAVRLAPEDADAHYQLGNAYRQTGRTDLAEEQFTQFRQLKDKQRARVK
jgi:tetratricopeptide (TPR) repeat protein